ncbi:hypothetical protein L9F63_011194, partial [Diploptera punctata]
MAGLQSNIDFLSNKLEASFEAQEWKVMASTEEGQMTTLMPEILPSHSMQEQNSTTLNNMSNTNMIQMDRNTNMIKADNSMSNTNLNLTSPSSTNMSLLSLTNTNLKTDIHLK